MTIEVERQRAKLVNEMTGMLERMARSRDYLTTDQRYQLAETLRNTADHLDRGKTLAPHPYARFISAKSPRRRLVPATRRNGELLYRLV